jgi:hypothetical protein
LAINGLWAEIPKELAPGDIVLELAVKPKPPPAVDEVVNMCGTERHEFLVTRVLAGSFTGDEIELRLSRPGSITLRTPDGRLHNIIVGRLEMDPILKRPLFAPIWPVPLPPPIPVEIYDPKAN